MSAAAAAGIRGRRRTNCVAIGERVGFDGAALAQASRLVAKVDSAAVQDGFDLYLHGFIVTDDGRWVVVQQGMNGDIEAGAPLPLAVGGLTSFVDAPHAAIEGAAQGNIVNLADHRAEASRRAQVELLQALGAGRDRAGIRAASRRVPLDPSRRAPDGTHEDGLQLGLLPHLIMPDHHDVRGSDVVTRRLHGNLAAAAECGPTRFRRTAAGAGRRRAHRARAGAGRRGGAWRALPLHRPGALLARARRQGPPSRFRCRPRSTTTPSAC